MNTAIDGFRFPPVGDGGLDVLNSLSLLFEARMTAAGPTSWIAAHLAGAVMARNEALREQLSS